MHTKYEWISIFCVNIENKPYIVVSDNDKYEFSVDEKNESFYIKKWEWLWAASWMILSFAYRQPVELMVA